MARHKSLRQDTRCIYCGVALKPNEVTVDHVPPLALFDFRDRPKGLEFPSCKPCNNGIRTTDLVAAMISRIYPDGPTAEHAAEMERLTSDVGRRSPEVLLEMMPDRAKARRAMQRIGRSDQDGGILDLSGPVTSAHLEKFAARFGFAIHYHATKCLLPETGGVISKIFTNVDLIDGEFPSDVVDGLGSPLTLRAGIKEVSEQFSYGYKYTEDGGSTMGFASLRGSIAFFTFSAVDPAKLRLGKMAKIYRPGCLQQEIRAEFPRISYRRTL